MGLVRWRQNRCKVCGNEFRSSRDDAEYCSGKCRMRFLRKCDAITRGSAIAAAAPAGAATGFRPVTDVKGPPASVTRAVTGTPAKKSKAKPKAKPKKAAAARSPAAKPKPKGGGR